MSEKPKIARQIKFEIYDDASGEFRWRLLSSNGKSIAISGESYQRRNAAKRSLKALIGKIQADYFEILPDKE